MFCSNRCFQITKLFHSPELTISRLKGPMFKPKRFFQRKVIESSHILSTVKVIDPRANITETITLLRKCINFGSLPCPLEHFPHLGREDFTFKQISYCIIILIPCRQTIVLTRNALKQNKNMQIQITKANSNKYCFILRWYFHFNLY